MGDLITLKNGRHISIDGYLKSALDSLIWNVNNDWDFVIIITGDGMVRTGKSVLAMQIAAYLSDKLNTPCTISDNVFFDSKSMVETAQKCPKNSVFDYDEAREALATSKRFSKVQQDLVDFFNECGQLNHIFILVLPDYFSLNWELATNRSECLINVYRHEENTERIMDKEKTNVTVFHRGFFEFFNRKKKAELYWKAKRSGLRQYNLVTPNFRGSFATYYPIGDGEDEKEREIQYREKKRDALARFNEKHREIKEKLNRSDNALYRLFQTVEKEGITYTALAQNVGAEAHYFAQVKKYIEEKVKKSGGVPVLD